MTQQKKTRTRRMARPASPQAAPTDSQRQQDAPRPKAAKGRENSAVKKPSKAAVVLGLLQRPEGASLAELVAATGWLPHTTRAALTGMRKKDHVISKSKVDGVTRYSIAVAQS
jgi:hypothetical protein